MKQPLNTENKPNVKKNRTSYSHAKLDARWAKLREEAEDRQADHNAMTTKEKLDKALYRVSKGMGQCKKEIARLNKKLAAEKEVKKSLTPAKSVVK